MADEVLMFIVKSHVTSMLEGQWQLSKFFGLQETPENRGHVLTTKIVKYKDMWDKGKMSSLASKLIFIQVWHVYALCKTWGLFLDISNIIYKEIRRCPKTYSKMRWNYLFEYTRMKPSSRQSKRTYRWPNLESIWENYGDLKFATLLKPIRLVSRTGQTGIRY
jgi:hypothetical protein